MTKEFLEGCLAEGLSLDQIAARTGRHPSTVSYHLKKHGLDPVGVKYRSKGGTRDKCWREWWTTRCPSMPWLGNWKSAFPTVRRWLNRYGFPTTPAHHRRAEARRARELGLKRVELECPHHGRTTFILGGSGYHRCLECRKAGVAEWRRRKKRQLVKEHGGACIRCGYNQCIAALEFHHRDRDEKMFSISRKGATRSFAELKAEAEKCDLLCSNCHAEVEDELRDGGSDLSRAA